MCTNSRPSGFSQVRMRPSSGCQLAICSNISTETTRSKAPAGCKNIHVGGDDRQVGQPARPRLAFDVQPLRRGVGNRGDAGSRDNCSAIHSDSEPQPQPSSSMSWPSFRPAWSRSLPGRWLPRRPGSRGRGIQAAGIFAVRPQEKGEEFGRQFVMLGVGGRRLFRNGMAGHGPGRDATWHAGQGHQTGNELAHAGPDGKIRQQPAFGQGNGEVRHTFGTPRIIRRITAPSGKGARDFVA